MSTNKVYGDRPNTIKLKEHKTRWDYDDDNYKDGIDENFPIDHSKHSIYGASKLSADILVQEYGRYFNMPSPKECAKKYKVGSKSYKDCVAYKRASKKKKKAGNQTGVKTSGAPMRRQYGGY